jgi:predicted transcriptional regulator
MNAVYPNAPGYKDVSAATSRQAAARMESRAPTLREKCFEVLKDRELTADEIADKLGDTVLSIRPRISELKAQGRICATEKRRCNISGVKAVVWKVKTKLVQPELI